MFGELRSREWLCLHWGTERVPYRGLPITVRYEFSYKTTTLTITLRDGRLLVDSLDHYTDSAGRIDRRSHDEFR